MTVNRVLKASIKKNRYGTFDVKVATSSYKGVYHQTFETPQKAWDLLVSQIMDKENTDAI